MSSVETMILDFTPAGVALELRSSGSSATASNALVFSGAKMAHLTVPLPALQLRQVELSPTSGLPFVGLIDFFLSSAEGRREARREALPARDQTWMLASSLPETMNCESDEGVARI